MEPFEPDPLEVEEYHLMQALGVDEPQQIHPAIEKLKQQIGLLRARVEELEAAPAVQRAAVEDLGLMWLHSCGTVGYGEHPTCGLRTLHSGSWYPLYIGAEVTP